jgi:lysophospholipase L1-like esterase
MKIAKSKKLKPKYVVLTILNLLIIAGAGLVIYNRFFVSPPVNDQPTNSQTDPTAKTIAFIGDYITAFGAEQATLQFLQTAHPDTTFTSINLATESLNSTAANESLSDELIADLSTAQVDTFFINLGATDAIEKVPTETYAANLNNIVEKLAPLNADIILNCAPYIDDGKTSTDGIILSYCQELAKIQADYVHFGDESAYAAFKNSENLLLASNGTHPNSAGYQKLGELWANVYNAVTGN